jgi:hypothetical protein
MSFFSAFDRFSLVNIEILFGAIKGYASEVYSTTCARMMIVFFANNRNFIASLVLFGKKVVEIRSLERPKVGLNR